MSEPRVISATFSDFRLVKGRKCLQLVFEVPAEKMAECLEMLGAPSIGTDKWCAIALLNGKPTEQTSVDDVPPTSSLAAAPQSGSTVTAANSSDGDDEAADAKRQSDRTETIGHRCVAERGRTAATSSKEPQRWADMRFSEQAGIRCGDSAFAAFLHNTYPNTFINTHDDPAETVRRLCDVKSRAELDIYPESRELWRVLDERFQAWLVTRDHGALIR